MLSGTVPAAQLNSTVNLNIGRRSGGFYFNGVIDELRIYNRPLSQVEIQSDMNTPLGGVTSDTQPPSAPGTLTATAISGTQVNLSWGAATDNVGVTGYQVERCQGTACSAFAQVVTPTGTTYNDTTLTAGSSYSYRVRATDAVPNLGPYSNIATATTTAAPDTQPPSTPGTLTATAISGTQINLNWGAATDNVGVTAYRLERCQGLNCTDFARIGNPTGVTYSDSGLLPNTVYSYQVRAQDAAVNLGPYSNIATVTTLSTIPGLVSAYSFSESSGSTIADASSSGNSGTINGSTWTANGKYGWHFIQRDHKLC